jgi:hypothetical protein
MPPLQGKAQSARAFRSCGTDRVPQLWHEKAARQTKEVNEASRMSAPLAFSYDSPQGHPLRCTPKSLAELRSRLEQIASTYENPRDSEPKRRKERRVAALALYFAQHLPDQGIFKDKQLHYAETHHSVKSTIMHQLNINAYSIPLFADDLSIVSNLTDTYFYLRSAPEFRMERCIVPSRKYRDDLPPQDT